MNTQLTYEWDWDLPQGVAIQTHVTDVWSVAQPFVLKDKLLAQAQTSYTMMEQHSDRYPIAIREWLHKCLTMRIVPNPRHFRYILHNTTNKPT
jgi:hypothetical protein